MPVETEGFDELEKALKEAERIFIPLASKAIARGLLIIEEIISPYPGQPARNRSTHFNTYVRGQGFYPKSAFVADNNEPGGFRTLKTKKTAIRWVSEQMDKKFRMVVDPKDNRVEGMLVNDASYSGYVIGPKDETMEPHQAAFHGQTGWVSADAAIEAATPRIMEEITAAAKGFIVTIVQGS